MRCFLAAVYTLAPFIAVAKPIPSVHDSHQNETINTRVLTNTNIEAAYTTVAIPWTSAQADDNALVFEIGVKLATDTHSSDVSLNDQHINVTWDGLNLAHSFTGLEVEGSDQVKHTVDVILSGIWTSQETQTDDHRLVGGSPQQHLTFDLESVDGQKGSGVFFEIAIDPSAASPLQRIIQGRRSNITSSGLSSILPTSTVISVGDKKMFHDDEKTALLSDTADFNYALEAGGLQLLEREAQTLHDLILTKKKAIATHLREQRDQLSLQKLLNECDGLVCAARVVAQRICDKVGVITDPDLIYAKVQEAPTQVLIDFEDEKKPYDTPEKYPQSKDNTSRPSTSTSKSPSAQSFTLPVHLTKNETAASLYSLTPVDLIYPSNPLVQALQIIAAALSLTALCAYVRRRCMSVRRRTERAADLEERRNARAYRRAARRAYMRKRWDQFMASINCFGSREEPRNEDYEEKRALILQDAFLEQLEDLEQAEKGEIMEAEIRELRHAREIVESLIRVSEHQYNAVAPRHDPPPPMVPLPFTPATRSRASTHTLPSYTSESLPGYSSRPATLGGSSCGSVVDGFYSDTGATSSDDEDALVPPAPSTCSDNGRVSRYTPTSSVVDVSPRASEDTLGTMLSRDTRQRQ